MAVYSDKKTGRLFVQFDYRRQTYKQYLPPGSSRADANKLQTKMRSDVFFQANGMAARLETLFEDFVIETYLPFIKANQSQAAFDRADDICTSALPFLKGKALRSIKPDDIEHFKTFRAHLKTQHGRERKPATVHREIAIISKLFSLAVKNDLCDYNPVSRIEKPKFDNFQDTVLDYEHDDIFFSSFDEQQGGDAKDASRLVLNTGLSQKDVLGLTAFHINLQKAVLNITRGKTKRHVEIPLNGEALVIVKAQMKDGLLFRSPKTGKRLLSIKTAIAGACKRANTSLRNMGKPEMRILTIMDLRRTFGTPLYESGSDAITIAQLLGHAGLRMIPRYVRSSKKARNAAENLHNPTQNLPWTIAR